MLIPRQAFMVRDFVGDDRHDSLNGIRVEPRGTSLATVATDGHRLAYYVAKRTDSASDFPVIDGVDPCGDCTPFTLPADAAEMIERAIPRKSRIPALGNAALDATQTDANGHAVFAVTDLETQQTFRPAKLDDRFPDYQAVIPTDEMAQAVIGIDLAYLESACKMLRRMGFRTAELRLNKPSETTFKETTTLIPRPIVLRAENESATASAVIMPVQR